MNKMSLLVWLALLLLIKSDILASYHQNRVKSLDTMQQCQNGRVCMNSCYFNGQLTNCNKRNVLKSVVFNPPFNEILPSIHLRLIRLDSGEGILNDDVIIKKENLTSLGMNIRFHLLPQSTRNIICTDWHACSLVLN